MQLKMKINALVESLLAAHHCLIYIAVLPVLLDMMTFLFCFFNGSLWFISSEDKPEK